MRTLTSKQARAFAVVLILAMLSFIIYLRWWKSAGVQKSAVGQFESDTKTQQSGLIPKISISIPLVTKGLAADESNRNGDNLEYTLTGYYVPMYLEACELVQNTTYKEIAAKLKPLCIYSTIASREIADPNVLREIFDDKSFHKISQYMYDDKLKKNIVQSLKSMQSIQPRLIIQYGEGWLAFCRIKQADSESVSVYKINVDVSGANAKLSNEGEIKEPFIQNIISAATENGFEALIK